MRICFHYEEFDRDISSGTIHAQYQWVELCHAFGITDACVINKTEYSFSNIGDCVSICEHRSLDDFLSSHPGKNVKFVEQGGKDFRSIDYSDIDFLVFGGTDTPIKSDIGLPTKDNVQLYPREAAAILLARVIWQEH